MGFTIREEGEGVVVDAITVAMTDEGIMADNTIDHATIAVSGTRHETVATGGPHRAVTVTVATEAPPRAIMAIMTTGGPPRAIMATVEAPPRETVVTGAPPRAITETGPNRTAHENFRRRICRQKSHSA